MGCCECFKFQQKRSMLQLSHNLYLNSQSNCTRFAHVCKEEGKFKACVGVIIM